MVLRFFRLGPGILSPDCKGVSDDEEEHRIPAWERRGPHKLGTAVDQAVDSVVSDMR